MFDRILTPETSRYIRDLLKRFAVWILLIRTPDGNRIFFAAKTAIDEIYNQKVYDRVFFIREKDIVVDVGANVGVYSLRASKLVGALGLIVAVEPEPTNSKCCKLT